MKFSIEGSVKKLISDEEKVKRYKDNLTQIRMLPLPPNLHLAVPVASLQEHAGYVMKLLDGMVSFNCFRPGADELNEISKEKEKKWLLSVPEATARQIVHYQKTGGLRRRLMALCKCSCILSRIHGSGMVYGDVSHNNIFISEDLKKNEVWLIDADNLRYDTAKRGPILYTPRYGAPELVKEEDGCRGRTDCHAFAVMAYQILVSLKVHPFIGDYVKSGGESDWADEKPEEEDIEQQAYRGEIPWIDDEEDDINRNSSDGLPRTLVLSDELKNLFQETFGPGRTQPWRRPTIYHWPVALGRAYDQTIECQNQDCGMTYLLDLENENWNCPYCDTVASSLLLAEAFEWQGTGNILSEPCWAYYREFPSSTSTIVLPQRLLFPFSVTRGDLPGIELDFEKTMLTFSKSETLGTQVSFAVKDLWGDRFTSLSVPTKIPLKDFAKGLFFFIDSEVPRLIKITFRKIKS